MDFSSRKSAALSSLSSPHPDKSPKGNIDVPIIPLLTHINLHPSYFTTSSCSGRISILATTKIKTQTKKKAGGGGWLYISHSPADPDEVIHLLFNGPHPADLAGGDVVFRFEPFILAVDCCDAYAAKEMVSVAVGCGFRESGITSMGKRNVVAVRCSIRMEVPLGRLGEVLVGEEYVRFLVGLANEKMEVNRRRTDGFFSVLQQKGLPALNQDDSVSKENGHTLFADMKGYNDSRVAECPGQDNGANAFQTSSEDLDHSEEFEVYPNKQTIDMDPNSEFSGQVMCSLSVDMLKIVGEPTDKLFIWGQSACTLTSGGHQQIYVFGGFGGLGSHARRNYSLMLDPHSGSLIEIDTTGAPSPRLGHSSSVVREHVFVIGGRGGPTQILSDSWVLDPTQSKWTLLQCTGSMFHPRHRHAAATVGSNIYVFGGLNNEVIYSSMHMLNTESLQWTEVINQGEWPCARHSHSMIAKASRLYIFGGFDGEKALGDLYSFDVKMLVWRKEKTTGRAPYPRFSHSMFIYKNFLGIIGGCPVRQEYQLLSLLNLDNNVWMHVRIESISRCLWVRSSTCVVGDNLVIIGGGAACYAFGTKFSEPMKINLQSMEFDIPSGREAIPLKRLCAVENINSHCENHLHATSHSSTTEQVTESGLSVSGNGHCLDDNHIFLRFEKKHAKMAKDILKKAGCLDLSRRVQRSQDGLHICLPINKHMYTLYQKVTYSSDLCIDTHGLHQLEVSAKQLLSEKDVPVSLALNFLLSCGGSLVIDGSACSRKASKSPKAIMRELVGSLLREKGMPSQLLEQLPARWERLGDIVILPVTSFNDTIWDSLGQELWLTVARSLGAQRLARQGRILPTGTRDSTLEILVGDNGWVTHQENGILYSFDSTKCMFSAGNLSEKLRMANLDCRDEIIVDLFAGIGYFVLPFLVKAKAKLVYACEWNHHALKALRYNVHSNLVADRCVILEGDNRVTAPKGVAHRICLGLLPSSEGSWATAVRALRSEGGMLHVHENVKDSEEPSWLDYLVKSISNIAQSEGLCWDVSVQHVERVKWYGPHIRHLVVDIRCK